MFKFNNINKKIEKTCVLCIIITIFNDTKQKIKSSVTLKSLQ